MPLIKFHLNIPTGLTWNLEKICVTELEAKPKKGNRTVAIVTIVTASQREVSLAEQGRPHPSYRDPSSMPVGLLTAGDHSWNSTPHPYSGVGSEASFLTWLSPSCPVPRGPGLDQSCSSVLPASPTHESRLCARINGITSYGWRARMPLPPPLVLNGHGQD